MMTWNELMAKLEGLWHDSFKSPGYAALSSVVILHKPSEDTDMGLICAFCKDMGSIEHLYPCPTVRAVEREFND